MKYTLLMFILCFSFSALAGQVVTERKAYKTKQGEAIQPNLHEKTVDELVQFFRKNYKNVDILDVSTRLDTSVYNEITTTVTVKAYVD